MPDTGRMIFRRRPKALAIAVALALLALACGPAAEAPTPTAAGGQLPSVQPTLRSIDEPSRTPTDAPGQPTDPPPAGGQASSPAASEPPAALPQDIWRTAQLLDVRSGETLTINELHGRLVVIEPMAIWCANCRAQQNEAREALARLGRDDIVYISLDVDPNETEADLARYADERNYPWHFAVASREAARSLAETFGDQVLSPPSTPKIVVNPDGTTEVTFGIKRAADLEADFVARLP